MLLTSDFFIFKKICVQFLKYHQFICPETGISKIILGYGFWKEVPKVKHFQAFSMAEIDWVTKFAMGVLYQGPKKQILQFLIFQLLVEKNKEQWFEVQLWKFWFFIRTSQKHARAANGGRTLSTKFPENNLGFFNLWGGYRWGNSRLTFLILVSTVCVKKPIFKNHIGRLQLGRHNLFVYLKKFSSRMGQKSLSCRVDKRRDKLVWNGLHFLILQLLSFFS